MTAMVETLTVPLAQKRKRGSSVTIDCSVKRRRSTRREGKSVRFSAEDCTWTTRNLFEGLNELEQDQLRTHLWYTTQDFKQFMEDRIHTMRVWHAVGGDNRLMEPNYSLRGLESFQSTLVNNEMQFLRSRHMLAVLKEQERQRLDPEVCKMYADAAENLAKVSIQNSSWAVDRAIRFGIKDSVDASAYLMNQTISHMTTATFGDDSFRKSASSMHFNTKACMMNHPRQFSNKISLQELMPKLSSSHASSAASREFISNMSSGFSLGDGFSHPKNRSSVNVPMLKQLNREFLRGLVGTATGNASSLASSSLLPCGASSMGTLDLLNEALNTTDDSGMIGRFQ